MHTVQIIAENIALEAHTGQFRNNGTTPYIEHPRAVRNTIIDLYALWSKYGRLYPYGGSTSDYYIFESAALLHDVVEDASEKGFTLDNIRQRLVDGQAPIRMIEPIITAVRLLTRDKSIPYLEYLAAIKTNPVARLVKLADLQHNMSDLKLGTLRDKYQLAEWFLLQ